LVRRREKLPEVGWLVIGTVDKVFEYGAYLKLDEYNNMPAFLPWSELSSKWVRNIRDIVKEGQKVVVKVIRVDRRKGHVDVSLKRVSEGERRRKILEWKRAQKADKILEIVAKKIGKTIDDAYSEVGWKLEDVYGEIYKGFEEATIKGAEVLRKAGVPNEWIEPLLNELKKHIEVKKLKIQYVLSVRSLSGDGVHRVKKLLCELYPKEEDKEVKVRIYTAGPPRYILEVVSTNFKKAEALSNSLLKRAERLAKKLNVEFAYQRVK